MGRRRTRIEALDYMPYARGSRCRYLEAYCFLAWHGWRGWKDDPDDVSICVTDHAQCADTTHSIDHSWPSALHLPKFLATIGYVEPLDLNRFDNYTEVFGLPYWERCAKEPDIGASFGALSEC